MAFILFLVLSFVKLALLERYEKLLVCLRNPSKFWRIILSEFTKRNFYYFSLFIEVFENYRCCQWLRPHRLGNTICWAFVSTIPHPVMDPTVFIVRFITKLNSKFNSKSPYLVSSLICSFSFTPSSTKALVLQLIFISY